MKLFSSLLHYKKSAVMIKSVRIKNFKSLADVAVSLDPVTVLIGRSGTGKTNFLQAIRLLRDYLQNTGCSVEKYGGWAKIFPAAASQPQTLEFEITFDAPGAIQDYRYLLKLRQQGKNSAGPPTLTEEMLSLGQKVIFHVAREKWVETPAVVSPPAPQGLKLGALTGVPMATTAHVVLSKGIGVYTFPDSVLLASVNANGVSGLVDDGGNFLEVFRAMITDLKQWNRRHEMLAALRQLNDSVESVEPEMPGAGRIHVSHRIDSKLLPLDLNQESEGFRRFLAHLLALYQIPSKECMIFDEPERGIHAGALATLTEQFKACADSGRGQVILVTHSPEMLDHFAPELLRVVELVNLETKIGPVSNEQREAIREQLLRPGELLTVDQARMAMLSPQG